jgi:hypothetical protein
VAGAVGVHHRKLHVVEGLVRADVEDALPVGGVARPHRDHVGQLPLMGTVSIHHVCEPGFVVARNAVQDPSAVVRPRGGHLIHVVGVG